MGRRSENALSIFKYILAIAIMYLGIQAAFTPLQPIEGELGYIYANRFTLAVLGIVFFSCGASLLYGKVRRSRRWTGRGLFSIYLCLLFATLIQFLAFGKPEFYIPNFLASFIVGALWLRWKFKTEYVNPGHFKDDIVAIRTEN